MTRWCLVAVAALAGGPLVVGACAERAAPQSPPPEATVSVAPGPTVQPEEPIAAGAGGTASSAPQTAGGQAGAEPPATTPGLGAGVSLPISACKVLISQTMAAIDATRGSARACKSDTDCVVIPDSVCVAPSCGAAVAKTAEARYRAERDRIAGKACDTWNVGGCARQVPIPTPSCAPLKPACKAGVCTAEW